jgi:putative integral membrane protein (TIGR02587 family)
VAYAVAFAVAGAVLLLLGVLEVGRLTLADLGTVAIQAVPAALGAALAQSQLGGVDAATKAKRERGGYWAELLLMAAGALFLAFNVAPTEEVLALAHGLAGWQFLAIVAVSLGVKHAFVYGVGFKGQESRPEHRSALEEWVQLTLVGYVVALLVCLYVLWVLGRTDGQTLTAILQMVVVLGFPAALGAAAARLIL